MRKAILVGINYVGTSYKLNGCVEDAVSMCEKIIGLGYKRKDILVLIDDDYSKNSVVNPSTRQFVFSQSAKKGAVTIDTPTKRNFIKYVGDILSNDNVSEFFLSYSGHGTNTEDCDGDEDDHCDEMICTLEGYISDDELFDLVNSNTKNRKNPLVIYSVFDCCHSGTVMDMHYMKKQIRNDVIYTVSGKEKKLENNNVIMMVWSGCQDNQFSYENKSNQNSVTEGNCTNSFKHAIDAILKTTQSPSGISTTCLDIHNKMIQHLNVIDSFDDNEVKDTSKYQVPNFSCNIKFDENNTFKFLLGNDKINDILKNGIDGLKVSITKNNGDDKSTETKPDETKPNEIKPDETKPNETKPDETKPNETKPNETKPNGTKLDKIKTSICPTGRSPRNKITRFSVGGIVFVLVMVIIITAI